MSNTRLSVENLSLSLGSGKTERLLVKEVSFSVNQDEIMGLIGESGCGKSLSCLAVMGLLPNGIRQVSGDICLDGRPLRDLDEAEIRAFRGRKAAMILQNPMSCFDSVFTIRHHFKETLASHGFKPREVTAERLDAALVEVGFDRPRDILDLYPFQMSGGMLQRVMVALALTMNVSLLIADEPTTDLDVVSQARILDLLAGVRERHGVSILLVTHDLSVIARLADKVAVMQNGEIVESGRVGDIFTQNRHPYTQALMQAHLSLYGPALNRFMKANGAREHEIPALAVAG